MSDEEPQDEDIEEDDLEQEDLEKEQESEDSGSNSFVLAHETWDCYEDAQRFGLSWQRRRVYALITQTFAKHRQELSDSRWYVFGRLLVIWPVLGYYTGYLSVAGVYYALHWLLGTGTNYVLYTFVVCGLGVAYILRFALQDQDIGVAGRQDKENKVFLNHRFSWGRYQDAFDDSQMLFYLMGFSTLFGLQVGLQAFTDGHLGLPIEGRQAECFWITLDNLCHGVFLDVCELYDLRLTDKLTHSFWSASVFLFFRLGFNAMLVLAVYHFVWYLRLRHFFRGYPEDAELTPATLSAWVRRLAADERHWAHTYSDEFIFLLMVDEYLQGHDYTVRSLHHRFPQLSISDKARNMFIGRGDEWLLYDHRWPAKDDAPDDPSADEDAEEFLDEELYDQELSRDETADEGPTADMSHDEEVADSKASDEQADDDRPADEGPPDEGPIEAEIVEAEIVEERVVEERNEPPRRTAS
jgi:hypothetical protein